jgi:endonuclease/exonuclease/phosphatase family metal-dependent hydrolase
VVEELKEIGVRSIYHHQFNEFQGEETKPTFYLHRNTDKPYHIDYAFASNDLYNKSSMTVGAKEEWLSISDHLPLCIEIDQ